MDKVLILLQLALSLSQQAQRINQLLLAARSEGRDVTDAEIEALVGEDDVARAALDAAIAQARAEGR